MLGFIQHLFPCYSSGTSYRCTGSDSKSFGGGVVAATLAPAPGVVEEEEAVKAAVDLAAEVVDEEGEEEARAAMAGFLGVEDEEE